LQEGRQLPIYNRRRYIEVKTKTDFLSFRDESDAEIVARQVQLAEDMLESLRVMGESQRAFFAWETDPVSSTLVNGRPARRQPPPRVPPKAHEEPIHPPEKASTEEF